MKSKGSTMIQNFQSRSVPTNKEALTVYLPAEIKDALKRWAEIDQRSMAFLAEQFITEAVKQWQEKQDKTDG